MSCEKLKFRQVCKRMFENFFRHNINKNAAALAYYLLFAFFPLLIFVTNLLGLLDFNIYNIAWFLQQFLPGEVVEIIKNFLDYISNNSSHGLMWMSLLLTIWFTTIASQGLMDDVRQAYNLERPAHPVRYTFRQIAYTVMLLIVIALTLLLSFVGENVISFIIDILPEDTVYISDGLLNVWQYLRFVPVALLMFTAITSLYAISLDRKPRLKTLLPGAFFSLSLWLILSIGFSFFVENFANYSFIYGALGAVIVLLIWLYMSAVILILGAELNAILQTPEGNNQ